ncbi:MAG: alpha-glucan family phosphorylase, partial [Thermodesulfobacteriota bacterium]|nr:alpha-glucan family phosphorylase [Thermodesulfobacteriota bacterium]
MYRLQSFQVLPKYPEPLSFIEILSRNLWWSWQTDAIELFRRIDPKLWEDVRHNPVVFLTRIPQNRLEELTADSGFLSDQQRLQERFESMVCADADGYQSPSGNHGSIAYFSMEFGIHESLPLFAGGLGILAGDYLKAASDMDLPLIGIGLLYRYGYFRQFLDQEGLQQEEYPETDLYQLPIERALDLKGKELVITITLPGEEILAAVWKVMIGRVPLYLLDTNLQNNSSPVREITSRLYPGDQKRRLVQEILLGIGGMRGLSAMGIFPAMIHLNEGHAAFALLERLSQVISMHKVDLKTALEIVSRTTVFTTHTPIPAAHEEYPADLVKPFFQILEEHLGLKEDKILAWGKASESDPDAPFSPFVLGLHMAQHCNGISRLHGQVARRMWSGIWPGRPEKEIPISHITNGVHIPTWVSEQISTLFERYIGPEWNLHPWNPDMIKRIDDIYDEELWRAHEMSRSRLIRMCRQILVKQSQRRNAHRTTLEDMERILDQDILTIAFAKRFATYKRAYLLFQDPGRLETLVASDTHPVQFIFAGKAHPKDCEGKDLIKRLIEFVRMPEFRSRIIFLEDYDIHMARRLVRGADVWLNTPRRPFEACGTSGMKAAINGGLNVSVLDGWWCEGYSEDRGWQIGDGKEHHDHAYQDAVESRALYNILENEVIPSFYDRKNGDMPIRWLKMMKESMKMAMIDFCSHRMVGEYEKRYYLPAAKR